MISNTLQNLSFVRLSFDEIEAGPDDPPPPPPPLGIKCGSEIACYKKPNHFANILRGRIENNLIYSLGEDTFIGSQEQEHA